MPVAFLFSTLQ